MTTLEGMTMDAATKEHLARWIRGPYAPIHYTDGAKVMRAMVHQYQKDPERYDREGWPTCFDDMCRAQPTLHLRGYCRDWTTFGR